MIDVAKILFLKHYDLDYQFANIEYQTNLLVNKTMNDFRNKYKDHKNITFILYYNNNIYSLLTYRIIKNLESLMGFDLKIYGKCKKEYEKEMFKNVKTIGYNKLKRLKNKVLISDYNPICNVVDDKKVFNLFEKIEYPIIHFIPKELEILQSFYIKPESEFYRDNICRETNEIEKYYNLFNKNYLGELDKQKELEYFNNSDLRINVFYLSGTEKDFELYSLIRASDSNGIINIYVYENNLDFIKVNLNPYVTGKNRIGIYDCNCCLESEFNIDNFKKENPEFNINEFNWKDYAEEEK